MKNPSHVILIRPANFGFNSETATSNKFQQFIQDDESSIKALCEFDSMVTVLKSNQISTTVFEDTIESIKPDAIFPNNWISTHPSGTITLYPMEALNRRLERRNDVVDYIKDLGFNQQIDLTESEKNGQFLEGTGSVIFDPNQHDAYACISSRTDVKLFESLCEALSFTPISFVAEDVNGNPIYHTNVMLSIGQHIVVVCSESIMDPIERAMVMHRLQIGNREVIDVTFSQMSRFACNCLEVNDALGNPHLIMSSTAYNAFSIDEINRIQQVVNIIAVDIPTIESIGGGSARCMLLGVITPSN